MTMKALVIALGIAVACTPIATIPNSPPAHAGYAIKNPAECDEFLFIGVDRSDYAQCIADGGPVIEDSPPVHHLVNPDQQSGG
jgi:hypothetical protein